MVGKDISLKVYKKNRAEKLIEPKNSYYDDILLLNVNYYSWIN
jgi:hypothetical protein